MANNVFIFHGAYGNPSENWFPWLKDSLTEWGYEVYIPHFPTPSGQNLDTWLHAFKEYESKVSADSIFVGHSLGCAFILTLLEKMKRPIHATFLVAGFVGKLADKKFDAINATFCERDFNWAKIRENGRRFYVYHSGNDPYVPLEKGKELARLLHTDIFFVEGAGHFNAKAGYTTFRQLLDDISCS